MPLSLKRLPLALVSGVLVLIAAQHPALADDAADQRAKEIHEAAQVHGGFIVHLGCGDGHLTAALRTAERFQVHGLDASAENVGAARKYIQSLGVNVYGPVAVDRLYGTALPYGENMVTLLVADELSGVSEKEIVRVLLPLGVALIDEGGKQKKIVKPRPDNIDDWTHYMHDASGNAVAHDTAVGPPTSLQWVGSPRWSRHHDRMASMSALVSCAGRMFYIMDEGSRVSIQMPSRWMLIARDAFNGTMLWKRPIPQWENQLFPLKSGPTKLARRLVATPDTVYVTLGITAPLTAIDAITGEIVRTYEETKGTEEVIESAGMLFVLANPGEGETADFAPLHNTGDQARVRNDYHWNAKPRKVFGIEAATGKVLWSRDTKVAPITLSSSEERVLFHDGEKILCLDRYTGKQVWASKPAAVRKAVTMNFGPKLVLNDGVVLFAGGDQKMQAYSITDGKTLWEGKHDRSGYQSPEDLLVSGGLVWSAPTTSGRDSGEMTGRDPKTGEIKIQFKPDVETYWFHHRCYIAKATDKFLLPSRTGIEFVDPSKKNWKINHWVRGGCLYGVMPCNGLLYAPPHNCACYPEAKLFGFNALASPEIIPGTLKIAAAPQLERGPAYGQVIATLGHVDDWPTFRHDRSRSSSTKQTISTDLDKGWETKLGGRLSSVVIADGRLFVAQIDAHTVHALDSKTGEKLWSYTTGGRVDSPPTVDNGNVLFGSADGWVYCLRATDGALAWRFRAAPYDRRVMAYEQLESNWPVHGNVLVEDGLAYFVAGRSMFLDGGLRWYKVDVATGKLVKQQIIDDVDPEVGGDIQNRLQTLQMPVGLPDVLSADEKYIYMRSQRFDRNGVRSDVGPHSGQPQEQGAVQGGEGMHLFSPTGFLDDSWFHRSYWVFGRSFAGGHAGYYQAGKFTPSGRIMVVDDDKVYGYARKPQYYKWTTILEHHLFSSNKQAAPKPTAATRRGKGAKQAGNSISFAKSDSLDPTGTPLAVEAWVKATKPNGVVVSHGGPTRGYALVLERGKPRFVVRENEKVVSLTAKPSVIGKWVHLVAQLTEDKKLQISIDGELVASGPASGLLTGYPAQLFEIGLDNGGSVGNYATPNSFSGLIDEVRLYHGTLSAEQIRDRYDSPEKATEGPKLVLECTFDKGNLADTSGNKNNGQIAKLATDKGRYGTAAKIVPPRSPAGNRGGGSLVVHDWNQDLPLYVRAMVSTDGTLFVAGPPDTIDEEETFTRLASRDDTVLAELAKQDQALDGAQGAILQAVSKSDGKPLAKYNLDALPIWDGMAAANGKLFLATEAGTIVCFQK